VFGTIGVRCLGSGEEGRGSGLDRSAVLMDTDTGTDTG